LLIGLTGSYCAGKNHVAAILQSRGLPVLDVDRLGHICLEGERAAVFARFGEGVKGPDGSVNRKALGAKVFGRKREMAALEAIVHPEANRMTLEWIAARGGDACVVNAALLHKSSAFERLDAIILVQAPLPARLARARRRDGLPWPDILRRFASQRRFAAQYFSANADIFKVENPGIGASALLRPGAPGKTAPERRLERRIDEILASLFRQTNREGRVGSPWKRKSCC